MPVVCVVGDTAEVHALAVLCDRLFHHGAWVPLTLLGQDTREQKAAKLAMHSVRRLPGGPDRPVLVTTASQPLGDVERTVAELNKLFTVYNVDGTPVSDEPKFRAITPDELANESDRCFLADPTAYGTRQRVPMRDLDGELSFLTPLQLPLPEVAERVQEARWCIDVSVGGYVAPPRTALSSRALQDTAGQLPEAIVRAGQHGLTYGSANMGFVMAGAPPEARRAHPRLRFPTVDAPPLRCEAIGELLGRLRKGHGYSQDTVAQLLCTHSGCAGNCPASGQDASTVSTGWCTEWRVKS